MSGNGHEIDKATRLRIAANLRELKHKLGATTDASFAERLGMSRSVMNRALKGERTVGLDFLLAVHRALPDVSVDYLCEHEPDQRWYQASVPPVPESPGSDGARERAVARFQSWVRWYMETHPSIVPTASELARRLGVSQSAVHFLFEPGSTRAPSFETLLAARDLIGYPLDVILFCDPPTTVGK